MSTYAELQQRIADDINRSDFTSQIKRALLTAIRFYERRRWRFNQTATAIATAANSSSLALPSNFLVLDALQISASGSLVPLIPSNLNGILQMRLSSATGIPSHYYLYQNRIEIAVPPDSAYSCPLYYIKTLTELSADTDTNAWTQGVAQDLITYHATKLIWSNTLRNTAEALKFQQLEAMALNSLQMEEMQFAHLGLTPTSF